MRISLAPKFIIFACKSISALINVKLTITPGTGPPQDVFEQNSAALSPGADGRNMVPQTLHLHRRSPCLRRHRYLRANGTLVDDGAFADLVTALAVTWLTVNVAPIYNVDFTAAVANALPGVAATVVPGVAEPTP
jgi:hypothetical protein